MLRRNFLKSSGTLISALPLISINKFNMFTENFTIDNEVVKIKVGKYDCILFRDLMFKYIAKDFFINADQQELNESLKKYKVEPTNIPSPFIALLIQIDDKKVLIDTGIGFLEKPLVFRDNTYVFQGRLNQLLQKENIKKEDITDVIITHFHPDHIGGLFTGEGSLNFPNAKFHMHQEEWNYWHSSQSDTQPPLFKYFIEKNITPLKNLNLHLFKGDFVTVLPGITAVDATGHTPGQIALTVQSENDHLLYISDAFLHPLHIEKIDWQTNYDLEHEKAKQSRIKLLELAYKENMLVNAFHFDFPGLGRIDKLQNNWLWKYTEE